MPVAPDWPRYGNTLAGTPAATSWLRIDVRRDGGAWTHRPGAHPQPGLAATGGEGHTATSSKVTVSRLSH